MKYEDFAAEVRDYLQEANNLFDLKKVDEDPAFRKWRHNLTDLIQRIEDNGYEINCSIQNRLFYQQGSYTYDPSQKDHIDAFNRDLQDTIVELETIVNKYDKYGDPKAAKSTSEEKKQLEWPQKITLSWLYTHAPFSLWAKTVGFLLAAFVLGVSVGQSQLYEEVASKFNTAEKPNNQIQSTPKSGATD
ncbi:MAG: hypothetical protein DBP03_17675 [gamma proteobacterium symbiont of Ctena orbiculata]|nr:MAG: hypothetical protein DBP03_17675 [gamma proteobacterium symbiont of Ctena orbiculata]